MVYIRLLLSLFVFVPFLAVSQTATEDLAAARSLLRADDTLGAAVAFTNLIDTYPDTAECVMAYNDFVALAESYEGGEIPQTFVDGYAAQFPSIDAVTSPEAKWVVIEFYTYGHGLALEAGEDALAGLVARSVMTQSRKVFEDHPHSQVAIGAVQRYMEMARVVGDRAQDMAVARLEELLLEPELSPARWSARFTLAWHLGLTNGDRSRAKQLYATLITEAEQPEMQLLLSLEHPLYFVEVDCEFAMGDAQLRVGNHDEAITHFDRAANYAHQGKPTELADFGAARARQLKSPNDVTGAIARYEAHLEAYPDSDVRAEALHRLGRLEERRGDAIKAQQRYDESVAAGGEDNATREAESRSRLQALTR